MASAPLGKWDYINYAEKTQDPARTYGEDNFELLREMPAKNDPTSFFRVTMASDFTLPAL